MISRGVKDACSPSQQQAACGWARDARRAVATTVQLLSTRASEVTATRVTTGSQDRGVQIIRYTPFLRRSRRRPMATTKGFATAYGSSSGVSEQPPCYPKATLSAGSSVSLLSRGLCKFRHVSHHPRTRCLSKAAVWLLRWCGRPSARIGGHISCIGGYLTTTTMTGAGEALDRTCVPM